MFHRIARASLGTVAAVALVFASRGGPSRAQDGTSPQGNSMQELASAFRRVERDVESGDVESASQSLGALRTTIGAQPEKELRKNERHASQFAAHFNRMQTLAEETAELLAMGRPEGARQAFTELRGNCVSCHVKFRDKNAELGLFPAVDNTIHGSVVLRDFDGEKKTDRSGVLVFIDGEMPYRHDRNPPVLSQKNRQFEPRVLPVVKGTTVAFPNDDSILHNVFSLSRPATFDLDVYGKGESRSLQMVKTGVVRVYCNLHPEMAASVVVLGNPHFAMTDEDGVFVIAGVPDGKYVLRAWTPMGVEARQEIEISGGELVEVELAGRETLRPAPHKNKFGKKYPKKY